MSRHWALKRNKHNKLVLISMGAPVAYNYAQIPLTKEQAENTLKFSKDWKLVSNLNYSEYELKQGEDKYEVLLKRFFDVLRENKDVVERVPNKKFLTDVEGTGRLILTKDKKTIYIARRRNKKTGKIKNITEVNSVCISDFDRDLFFKDCRSVYGMLPEGSVYKLTSQLDESLFKVWLDFIEKEYDRQLERFNNKNKK